MKNINRIVSKLVLARMLPNQLIKYRTDIQVIIDKRIDIIQNKITKNQKLNHEILSALLKLKEKLLAHKRNEILHVNEVLYSHSYFFNIFSTQDPSLVFDYLQDYRDTPDYTVLLNKSTSDCATVTSLEYLMFVLAADELLNIDVKKLKYSSSMLQNQDQIVVSPYLSQRIVNTLSDLCVMLNAYNKCASIHETQVSPHLVFVAEMMSVIEDRVPIVSDSGASANRRLAPIIKLDPTWKNLAWVEIIKNACDSSNRMNLAGLDLNSFTIMPHHPLCIAGFLCGANLRYVTLQSNSIMLAEWKHVSLKSTNLNIKLIMLLTVENSDLRDISIQGCNNDSEIQYSIFNKSNLENSSWKNIQINNVSFIDCNLIKAKFYPNKQFLVDFKNSTIKSCEIHINNKIQEIGFFDVQSLDRPANEDISNYLSNCLDLIFIEDSLKTPELLQIILESLISNIVNAKQSINFVSDVHQVDKFNRLFTTIKSHQLFSSTSLSFLKDWNKTRDRIVDTGLLRINESTSTP